MENPETNQKTKRTPLVVGIILLVILSIGAAFVGGRLLKDRSKLGSSDQFEVSFEQAEGIPQSEPETNGIVTTVDGDTLTIQEFNMNSMMDVSGEGGVFVEEIVVDVEEGEELPENMPVFMGADGPEIEVVITHDTQIYKDVTFPGMIELNESGEMPEMPEKIEIKVELASADEIGTNSIVTVWGKRTGDRVVAEVILFQSGMSFEMVESEGAP